MNGVLSGSMQAGAGHAFRDGSLGSEMQTGSGHSFRDGSLGMQTGQGRSFRDGSLGCTAGCGGAMATGPGHAYREGSLGATVSYPRGDRRPVSLSRLFGRGGAASKKMSVSGLGAALGGVGLTMDLIIGAGVGAAAVYFLVGKKKG